VDSEFWIRDDTAVYRIGMIRNKTAGDGVRQEFCMRDAVSFIRQCFCVISLLILLNSPLNRVILAIDGSTECSFLETTVKDIWQNLTLESPNCNVLNPVVRLFMIRKQGFSEINQLMLTLFP
jgi:hypothetical protein